MIAAQAGDGGSTSVTFTFLENGVNVDLSLGLTHGGGLFTEGTNGVYTVTTICLSRRLWSSASAIAKTAESRCPYNKLGNN